MLKKKDGRISLHRHARTKIAREKIKPGTDNFQKRGAPALLVKM